MFQPDARAAHGPSNISESSYFVEYGRISIRVSDDGSTIHNYAPQHVFVTAEEVLLSIVLLSTENPVTLYAVRRLKIESYQNDFSVDIHPLQPNERRSVAASLSFFTNHPSPVDFSCVEIDRSSLTSGTKPARPWVMPVAHIIRRNARSCDHCRFRYFRLEIKHHEQLQSFL